VRAAETGDPEEQLDKKAVPDAFIGRKKLMDALSNVLRC
jgi:hypothetical protein